MSTDKNNYTEFTWLEWIQANDPNFDAEYERQNETSGFRPGSSGKMSRIRVKNGLNPGVTSTDVPLRDDYSIK